MNTNILFQLIDSHLRFQAVKRAGLDKTEEYELALQDFANEATKQLVDDTLTLRDQQHLSTEEALVVLAARLMEEL